MRWEFFLYKTLILYLHVCHDLLHGIHDIPLVYLPPLFIDAPVPNEEGGCVMYIDIYGLGESMVNKSTNN